MADKVHIGAGSLSLEAFVSVVLGRGALVLDEASLAKLAPTTSVAPAPPPRPSASAPILLSKLQSRAVALAAALQLQQGRSGASAEAVRALGAALVSGSLPALDAAGDVAAQLAATAAAPSPGDVAAFRSISAPAVGVAALAIFGVQASLLPADAIAALSIEALRGSAVPFDSDFSEHARPVAGCVASASTLRLMLEGSRWAGRAATVAAAAAAAAPKAGKAGKGAPTAAAAPAATVPAPVTPALASVDDSDAVVCVHQLHGAAHAGVAAAARTLAVELSASLPAGGAPSAPGTPVPRLHLQALLAAIGEAREAAGTLLAASSERLRLLRIAAAAAATATDASAAAAVHDASVGLATLSSGRIAALAGFRGPRTEEPLTDAASSRADALSAALQLQALVDALIAGLAAEAAAAEALISASEAPAAVEAAEKDARKAAAAAAREAAEALRVAAMSAEERAAWDAEVARKREKQAKRDAKDASAAPAAAGPSASPSSDGASNVLVLGTGTFETRAFLRAAVAALPPVGSAAPLPPALAAAAALLALSPYRSPALASHGAEAAAAAVLGAIPAAPVAAAPASGDADAAPSLPLRLDQFLRRLLERLGSGGAKRKAKIPKGTRDYLPEQMDVRQRAFGIIRGVFRRHGAVEIDTPVFELKETLMGKYGEEGGKLVYDLADQGGEVLSLRYDLTVPFARFLAFHGIEKIKRFHMARVYRRDNPVMTKGRYREFYQCDFDIAGVYPPMMPDAEVLKVATEILSEVPIGPFTIKLNHRGLLDASLEICGVPPSKFRAICSAIDKLDKEPWEAVREEMVAEKGLPGPVADKIGTLVQLKGRPLELLGRLTSERTFGDHAGAAAALAELGLLFRYLDAMGGALSFLSFDLSLARGLDYYTGVIYEAVLDDPTVGVGSIAAGGRYDNLVGMFASPGTVVPCVGVSIGVERVFAIMEARAAAAGAAARRPPVSVLVASIPSKRRDMTVERMGACAALWAAGIDADMLLAADPKIGRQAEEAAKAGIPLMVVLGEDECERGEVSLKHMASGLQETMPRQGLVAAVKEALRRLEGGGGGAAPAQAQAPTPASASAPPLGDVAGGAASRPSASDPAATPTPAVSAPRTLAGAASAASASSCSSGGGGSVGTVLEGAGRAAGHFMRPAAPVSGTQAV